MRVLILLTFVFSLICNIINAADFSEDFEKGMDNWIVVDEPAALLDDKGPSNWVVVSGPINGKALNQTTNIWGDVGDVVALGSFCIYDKQEWKDFEITFDMLANDNDGVGFVWGWKNRTNHYRFFTMIDPGNPGGAQGKEGDPGKAPWSLIEKRIGDGRPYYKTLAIEREPAYQQGAVTNFRIVVKNGTFEVYSNKKLMLSAKDNSYAGGKIGFTVYAQSGNFFDNIKLIDFGAPVEPKSKLASTWGSMKALNQ